METYAVNASNRVIDFSKIWGTLVPSVSWSSYDGICLTILCFAFNFYVIVDEIMIEVYIGANSNIN